MRPSKRDELVRKALAIFYRDGFHAAGMDLLAAETGISKTSMYKHFRTKEDLILAVLRLRDEEFRNWLFRRMERSADTPRARLLAMFDALAEWF
ncbi:MAG: AcrR family transcriptional regulator, partial [Paracoccaceae bacterium]